MQLPTSDIDDLEAGQISKPEQSEGIAKHIYHMHWHDKHLHAAAQTQDQVQRRLLLDVVVGQGAAILQLLAGEDQALLVRRDALLQMSANITVSSCMSAGRCAASQHNSRPRICMFWC